MGGRAGTSKSCYDLRRDVGRERGPNGRHLCTWCRTEVPAGRRRLWCSAECVSAYLVQSSQAGFRKAVWKRDRGVCARCHFDTDAFDRDVLRPARKESGFEVSILLARMAGVRCSTALWEADHIVPVCEGGADSLENARTLCRPCHLEVTAALRRRLAEARRTAIQPTLFTTAPQPVVVSTP